MSGVKYVKDLGELANIVGSERVKDNANPKLREIVGCAALVDLALEGGHLRTARRYLRKAKEFLAFLNREGNKEEKSNGEMIVNEIIETISKYEQAKAAK